MPQVNLSIRHALLAITPKGEGTTDDPARFVQSVWDPSRLELLAVIDTWKEGQYAATAGELLDALKSLVALEHDDCTGTEYEGRCKTCKAMSVARAAIAKAERAQ